MEKRFLPPPETINAIIAAGRLLGGCVLFVSSTYWYIHSGRKSENESR